MFSCRDCGSLVARRRRAGNEKILFEACFKCKQCGSETCKYRPMFHWMQAHVDCPLCGTVDVGRLSKVDKIDRMTRNPLRQLARLVGARLYHCSYCRFQFYDFREKYRSQSVSKTSKEPVRPAEFSATP